MNNDDDDVFYGYSDDEDEELVMEGDDDDEGWQDQEDDDVLPRRSLKISVSKRRLSGSYYGSDSQMPRILTESTANKNLL